MTPEQDFKILASEAYQVDVQKSGEPWITGDILENKNLSHSYEVLKVEDNTTNGMQAMAVAPVKNGKVDTSEVVIAFAGTNPKDSLDIMTDIQTVGLGNKVLIPKSQQIDLSQHGELDELGIPKSIEYVEGQVMAAEKFVNELEKDYPNAMMITTGHSLGEYIALYIAAEKGLKNIGFNGPDPYNILSPEAKRWVEENPGMLINYSNKYDKIGNVNGDETGSRILVDMDMGSKLSDTLKFHNLSAWKFDKDGNLYISDSYENREARQIRAEKLMHQKMAELSILANNLNASGGGLSSNEEIFLDNAQALLTVDFISQSMKIGLESVINIYKDAITEAEEIWENGIELAQSIGTELSYGEILSALEARGVTKYSVVFEPTAYYREKITNALRVGEDFERLATEIKANIEELEKADKDLANQIQRGA